MKKNLFLLVMACVGMLFVGCDPVEQQGGETQIKSITIKNTTCQGTVDNTAFTVLFEAVPAETPVEALQFDAKCSLGASLDQKEYDFTKSASEEGKELVGTIKVVNGGNSQEYTVTIKLSDPTENPKLAKLVMKKADGTEVVAGIFDESVALNMESESEATFGSITLYPTRASYRFTTMADNKISKDNPGQLVVEFMGKKTTYNLTFDAAPTPGADLAGVIVHDFSKNTDNIYSPFASTASDGATELTRSSDFDGEHVLVVSRADATTPTHHLLKVSDLLAGNINKVELSTEGVSGGMYVVSAGCLSHSHIYVCNLATKLGGIHTLKVYHYASPTATPEVCWEWNGALGVDENGDTIKASPRLGDNISVNLDESGNGYAFFCGQETSAERIYRVEVANFNEFSNPTEITLDATFAYYGKVNQVDNDRYLLTSHYNGSTWLMDKEGNMLADIMFQTTAAGLKPQNGVDPRVVKYNNGYYMLFSTPYQNNMNKGGVPGVYMIDITEECAVSIEQGMIALSNILWEDEEGIWEPDYFYSLDPADLEADPRFKVTAPAAQCNAAVVDGKLLVYTAALGAGFAILEFPAAK